MARNGCHTWSLLAPQFRGTAGLPAFFSKPLVRPKAAVRRAELAIQAFRDFVQQHSEGREAILVVLRKLGLLPNALWRGVGLEGCFQVAVPVAFHGYTRRLAVLWHYVTYHLQGTVA